MLSLNGIYDKGQIRLTEPVSEKRKFKVVVTFIEAVGEEEDIAVRNMASNPQAFEFWNDPAEDIYQDYLPKK